MGQEDATWAARAVPFFTGEAQAAYGALSNSQAKLRVILQIESSHFRQIRTDARSIPT